MRRIFGPIRDEVTWEWRKLHEELNDYSLPSIAQVIEMNEMGKACSTYVGEVYTRFWCGNLREKTTWKTRA